MHGQNAIKHGRIAQEWAKLMHLSTLKVTLYDKDAARSKYEKLQHFTFAEALEEAIACLDDMEMDQESIDYQGNVFNPDGGIGLEPRLVYDSAEADRQRDDDLYNELAREDAYWAAVEYSEMQTFDRMMRINQSALGRLMRIHSR